MPGGGSTHVATGVGGILCELDSYLDTRYFWGSPEHPRVLPKCPPFAHGLVEAGWSDRFPRPCVCSLQCGRHQGILQLVCSFIERTFMATSSDAHMATELGYLFILQDQVKEASLWYSKAMKLDESSVAALTCLKKKKTKKLGAATTGTQSPQSQKHSKN